MIINCIIVDDEPLSLDLLEGYVNKTPFLNLIARCNNAFEAIEVINNSRIDLIFLDIQMPDLSGIELSKTLQKGPKIIFTTAFEQYALEGFKVEALDYLLKPISYPEFLTAANKAKKWFDLTSNISTVEDEQNSIFVKSEYRLVKIELNKVLYIEGLKDYVKIVSEDQDKAVLSLMSLKSLETKLPVTKFMRVHRSYIVHLDKITTIERNRIVFGKTYIPIADKYKDTFQEFLSKRFLK